MKKISPTFKRRDYSVTPNGFFTVLRPSGRLATLNLSNGVRKFFGSSNGVAPTQTIALTQIEQPGIYVQNMKRLAVIVLAACAITSIVLWLLIWAP
jgi:hypothetical protein